MKEVLKTIWQKIWPIIISAGAAAGISFLQSLAHAANLCPAPLASPAEVGLLGGTIHIAINALRLGFPTRV